MNPVGRLIGLCLILFSLSAGGATREPAECPWLYSNFVKPKEARAMDPSDYKAIQDLLKNVFLHPERSLSADALVWIQEFELHAIVEQVRAEGLRTQSKLKRQRLSKGAAVAAGASLVTALLARKVFVAAHRNLTLEESLNERFGFALQGNSLAELRFLEAMVECNPNPGAKKIPASIRSRLAPFSKVGDLAMFLLLSNTLPESDDFQVREREHRQHIAKLLDGVYSPTFKRLFNAYNRTGLVFCTRWGTTGAFVASQDQIEMYLNTLEGFGFERKKDFMDLRGVVLVPAHFQDKRAAESRGPHSGLYRAIPGARMIQIFQEDREFGIDPGRVDETLAHEMGHHISRQNGYGTTLRWQLLFAKGLQQDPAEEPRIFPTSYASSSPEEFFAESISRYIRYRACRKLGRSGCVPLHPEVQSFVEEVNGRALETWEVR